MLKYFLILIFYGSWVIGSDLHYYCTAADSLYYTNLINLIGSIHKNNFENLGQIAVFNLGLSKEEVQQLKTIDKLEVYEVEKTHEDILKSFPANKHGKVVPGWYMWKLVAIKTALDMFPYVLWIDAGSTVLKPLDCLFEAIEDNGYLLFTNGDESQNGKFLHPVGWGTTKFVANKFDLYSADRTYILESESVEGGFLGASRKALKTFVEPLYLMTRDIRNFQDDGTTPNGFGTCRHDQTIISIFAYINKLKIYKQDYTQNNPIELEIKGRKVPYYMTWNYGYVSHKTHVYRSRSDLSSFDYFLSFIHYKK